MEPPSAFMNAAQNFLESSSSGKNKFHTEKHSTESQHRGKKEVAARVSFLGTLPKEEWKVLHPNLEIKTGCGMNRVAFLEEVWPVLQRNE